MFKYNEKVKLPTTKSAGCSLEVSHAERARKEGQDYLYFVGYREDGVVALNKESGWQTGDLWLASEVEAYEKQKFKKGDKVKIPTQKTVLGYGDIEHSSVVGTAIKRGQDHLFVTDYEEEDNCYVLDYEMSNSGDFFNERDLELYPEVEKFPVGTKVKIPTQKTAGEPAWTANADRAREKGQPFLYVSQVFSNGEYVLSEEPNTTEGDFYHERDLELYEEPIFFKPVSPYTVHTEEISLEEIVKQSKKQTEELGQLLIQMRELREAYEKQGAELRDLTHRVRDLEGLTERIRRAL